MKQNKESSNNFPAKKYLPYLRIFIGITAILLLLFLAFREISGSSETASNFESSEVLGVSDYRGVDKEILIASPNEVQCTLKEPDEEEIVVASRKYQEKLQRIEEEKRRQEEELRRQKMIKVNALLSFLEKRKSPMAPYAESIIDVCMKYGDHFCKMHLSIAAVESGLGRIPIGCCNAWGMIGKYYPSWEVSIPQAADWFARNYYNKGIDTFEELAYSSYGPQNPEKWIRDLYSFYNQIPL